MSENPSVLELSAVSPGVPHSSRVSRRALPIGEGMSICRTMRPDNSIDYLEFASRDLPATKAFFTALLGWSFQDYGPDYIAFEDGKMTGGFFHSETVATAAEGAPLVVLYHSDLPAAKARVEELGGTIKRDIFSFPGGSRFHFGEPGGNEFAVWSE